MLNDVASSAFVPLGDWVREKSAPAQTDRAESTPEPVASAANQEILSFAEEVCLLRLRVVESFERSRKRLLRRFAEDVLARELALTPADIEALAQKALAAFAQECPASLLVSPADAAGLRADVSVRVDASLESGDLIVDVADGRFESPLRLRAAQTLQNIGREEEL